MKDLFENTAVKGVNLKGKIGATFGSYGWSGEAPRIVAKIIEEKFGMKIAASPTVFSSSPTGSATNKPETKLFSSTITL